MSTTPSPKTSLAKLVLYPKPKPFKVMVLGQSGVGKSALVVRFITRRFIGEYDPNLEKIYSFQTVIDNETVYFEILDSAGETHFKKNSFQPPSELYKLAVYLRYFEGLLRLRGRPLARWSGDKRKMAGSDWKIKVEDLVQWEMPLSRIKQDKESEYANLESNIRWAEAFILMYSVTDKCSFDECHRLKFLINYNKRRRKLTSTTKDNALDTPVVMVGNKTDQLGDRMVTGDEGQRRSKEIGCVCFHEISVRESIDQVMGVFRDARRFWRVSKWSRGRADETRAALCRPLARAASDSTEDPLTSAPLCRRWTERDFEEEDEWPVRSDSTSSSGRSECAEEFRARASTDSRLPPRPARPRHPPLSRPFPATVRRMSVAMRGDNASTY